MRRKVSILIAGIIIAVAIVGIAPIPSTYAKVSAKGILPIIPLPIDPHHGYGIIDPVVPIPTPRGILPIIPLPIDPHHGYGIIDPVVPIPASLK